MRDVETRPDGTSKHKAASGALKNHLRQFYWTVTAALGLKNLHGKEREIWLRAVADSRFAGWCAQPFVRLYESVTGKTLVPVEPYAAVSIGHLALDFDTYLKNMSLAQRSRTPVFVLPENPIANPALLALWRERARFVKSEWLSRLLTNIRAQANEHSENSLRAFGVVMRGASQAHRVEKEWGDRPPIVGLSKTLSDAGHTALEKMGIPPGAWYVCVHNREGGYAPQYEWANEYRNSPIADLIPAMAAIVARGGYCIRMGDPTMQPLPALDNVIDYVHSPFKSDWMDVYLTANCRFFFGTSSGLYCVAGIFGRPSVQVNVTPMGCVLSQFPQDISIPKMVRDADGRVMPFGKLFADDASSFRNSREFAGRQMTHVNNTPEEIVDVVREMMDRLDGVAASSAEDNERQQKFRSFLTTDHYSYHSGATVGAAYLRRHKDLLA